MPRRGVPEAWHWKGVTTLQIDIHIMTQPPSGEWVHFQTELTNGSGRVSYVVPESKRLGIGVYPVKMVVRCCCWPTGFFSAWSFRGSERVNSSSVLAPLLQGGPHVRRQLSYRRAAGDGVCSVQHWRLVCSQRLHHGQRPQGQSWSCGRGEVSLSFILLHCALMYVYFFLPIKEK